MIIDKDNISKQFFIINFFITSLIYLLFLSLSDGYDVASFVLTFFGVISTVTTFYFVLYLLSFLFRLSYKFLFIFFGFVFVFFNTALIVDFFVFKIYKFHINSMVLNIIFTPEAWDSIQLGLYPFVSLTLFVLLLIFIEVQTIRKIKRKGFVKLQNLTKKKSFKIILLLLLLVILVEKVTYGFLDVYGENRYISKFQVIPLYQPLTFTKFADEYLGIKANQRLSNRVIVKSVNYPLGKIKVDSTKRKFNIFILGADAVQSGIFSKDVMPNIYEFSKDAIVLKNHYSGGIATRFGLFSLMQGINGIYWWSFLNANKGSVLFDVLKKLNYKIKIVFSTSTKWPEFRRTCFANLDDNEITDDFEGSPWQKDKQASKYFGDVIKNYKGNGHLFAFLFMDAPHGYSYPAEFNKFKAKGQNVNYLTVDKKSSEVKNALARYKNAIYYDDYLIGEILNTLKEKKLYENSMIIITSDHGQEFYEYGFFGHNSAFSPAQTRPIMLIKLPKFLSHLKVKQNSLTSHTDIVPTIMSLLGVNNNPEIYSNGKNIFDKNYKRGYVFCANWNENAIITEKYIYIFSNLPNKIFSNEVRDSKTYKKVNVKVDTKLLLKAINEDKKFLR